MNDHLDSYRTRLISAFNYLNSNSLGILANAMRDAWSADQTIYFCGNGGSAGNAIHLANDFIYGAGLNYGKGLKVEALSSNPAVLTCLANDIGYDHIYSEQIRVKAAQNDILVTLSGSGNSPNILKALEMANSLGVKTFAILGFDGGKAKKLAQNVIHIPINDMQIAEDFQLIIGHICMQWLCQNSPSEK